MSVDCDILMITHNRPSYTRLTLARLLETCGQNTRVWVWHNGEDGETLEVVRSLVTHPRVHEFHHSRENKRLNEPTNWLWENSKGALLGKVDDDCLVPPGWAQALTQAHQDVNRFGIIACWHYFPEDIVPDLVRRKLRSFAGGHQLMVNCWVGGSGYLMKRRCIQEMGPLSSDTGNFSAYGINLAAKGWVNGWYYPFLFQDHLDDPRSSQTLFTNQAQFEKHFPLSAGTFGCKTIEQWQEWLRQDCLRIQRASPDPRQYVGWRPTLRQFCGRVRGRLARIFGLTDKPTSRL